MRHTAIRISEATKGFTSVLRFQSDPMGEHFLGVTPSEGNANGVK
jgi:hypothetical protein